MVTASKSTIKRVEQKWQFTWDQKQKKGGALEPRLIDPLDETHLMW